VECHTEEGCGSAGDRVFAVEMDSQSTMLGKEDMNRSTKEEIPKKAVVLDK
jgi:hypothetical protein